MSQDNGKIATRERVGSEVPRQDAAARPKPGQAPGARGDGTGGKGGELVTSSGRTTIADGVVAKIAAMAAWEVGGVYAMGASMDRRIGSMKEYLPGVGKNATQGVAVEVGERQAAVDIDLVVEYGVGIPQLAGAVRDNVTKTIEHMCGLEVVEVNVTIDDIHMPGENSDKNDKNDKGQESKGKGSATQGSAPRVQ